MKKIILLNHSSEREMGERYELVLKKGLSSKVGDWLEEFRWKRWSVGEDSGEVVGILTDEALSGFKVGE